jgi:hypothetical protein
MRLFHQEVLDDDYTKKYYLDAEQTYNRRTPLVAKAMFPWALTNQEEFAVRLQGIWQQLNQDSNGTSSEKDEFVEQLSHRGLRQLPGCANDDIQADLEVSCMKDYSRKCSMRGSTSRLNGKATCGRVRKRVTSGLQKRLEGK